MFDVVVPLGVLLILLLGFRGFLQVIRSWMLNGTIRRAMEKQPEAVPDLLAKLGSTDDVWHQDVIGWALSAAGLAMVVAALIGDSRERLASIQIALVPFCGQHAPSALVYTIAPPARWLSVIARRRLAAGMGGKRTSVQSPGCTSAAPGGGRGGSCKYGSALRG